MDVTALKKNSFGVASARRAIAVAGILGLIAFAFSFDANVRGKFHAMFTANAEDRLAEGFHASLGDEGAMPELNGAIGWLNSDPLTRQSLRGKVVLVNFWTYTCINSIRPLPYLRNWAAKYKDAGFVVLGVHTPEFSFEYEPRNVETAVRNLNVGFPVAIDSKYRI